MPIIPDTSHPPTSVQPPEVAEIYTVQETSIVGEEHFIIFTPESPPLRTLSYRWALEVVTGATAGSMRQILNQDTPTKSLTLDSVEGISPGDTVRYY